MVPFSVDVDVGGPSYADQFGSHSWNAKVVLSVAPTKVFDCMVKLLAILVLKPLWLTFDLGPIHM